MTPLYFHKGVEGLLLGAKLREEIPYELRGIEILEVCLLEK